MSLRTDRLIASLPEAGVDLMLVTNGTNVRYLTGYTGSNGLAIIGPRMRVFITDFRYVEQSAEEVDGSFERQIAPHDLVESMSETLPEGALRLGFEDAHVSVRAHARLRDLLDDRIELVPVSDAVETLRLIKDRGEVERIRAACAVADAALDQVLSDGIVGRTEREVALALEWAMRERGAQRPSFESIIAAGPHGALPHAVPRDVVIEQGQLVVIDWGAELDGYCSDCTRTVATGAVGADAQEIYAVVRAAQLAGLEGLGAGRDGRAVDATAREVIDGAGYGQQYGHGLGHGVGLEIHEAPRLSRRSDDQLSVGNVVTVEPGIYLPGRFGVRIEDLVVVTDDGREILTSLTKDLRVVS
jgi:Xaa-Pro aminopeptidase